MEKYFKRGQEIVIEGQVITEEWKKDGENQSRTICNVEKINFCGPAGSTSSNDKPSDDFVSVPDGIDEELPFN